MHNARPFLISFVLEQADTQPVSKRIELYRALAEFVGNPQKTNELQSIANDLEETQRRCRQFAFNFFNESSSGTGNGPSGDGNGKGKGK